MSYTYLLLYQDSRASDRKIKNRCWPKGADNDNPASLGLVPLQKMLYSDPMR